MFGGGCSLIALKDEARERYEFFSEENGVAVIVWVMMLNMQNAWDLSLCSQVFFQSFS